MQEDDFLNSIINSQDSFFIKYEPKCNNVNLYQVQHQKDSFKNKVFEKNFFNICKKYDFEKKDLEIIFINQASR